MHSVRRVRTTAEQQEAKRRKEAVEITKLRILEAKTFKARASGDADPRESLDLTTRLLEMNPEHYTIWNYRRELLSEIGDLKLIEKDLGLVDQLMLRFPKVYWLWNHRKWVLEQLGPDAPWAKELMRINKFLTADARNFHGWHYRRQVIRELEMQNSEKLDEQELAYTTEKINSNFSNFSAWHNRSKLLPKVEGSKHRGAQLDQELGYSREAVLMDPDDQSAWIYYQWLLTDEYFKEEQPARLEAELKQIAELAEEEPDSKWCIYTLWLLSDKVGQPRPELLERMVELDPLRANRYKYLLDRH